MPIAVIGAGQGRSGTMSLKLALEQLGFGPCYHGGEQVYKYRSPGWHLWLRAFKRESFDWDELFSGYSSTVDSPVCLFYRELAENYPSAKVILTLREPNAWFDSVYATYLSPEFISHFKESAGVAEWELMEKEVVVGFGVQVDRINRDSVIAAYERHNADVQRAIPPDRLLVYDVTEGWEPLCRFLGVPMPATPFPRANSRADRRAAFQV
ncbi:MAG: sulfotransferase family protein [Steroidobacteraceae bacterium]